VNDRFRNRTLRHDAQALLPVFDFLAGPAAVGRPDKPPYGRNPSIQNGFDRSEDRQACRVIGSKDVFARVHVDQAVRRKLKQKASCPGRRKLASQGHNTIGQSDHFVEDADLAPDEVESKGQRVIFRKYAAAGSGCEDGGSDQLRELLHQFRGPGSPLPRKKDRPSGSPQKRRRFLHEQIAWQRFPDSSGRWRIEPARRDAGKSFSGPLQHNRTRLPGEGQAIRFRNHPGNLVDPVRAVDPLRDRSGDASLVQRLKLEFLSCPCSRLADDVEDRRGIVQCLGKSGQRVGETRSWNRHEWSHPA